MRLLLIEDNRRYADHLSGKLGRALSDSNIVWIETEAEFLDRLPGICSTPPDVVISDIMLKWTTIGDDRPAPGDAYRGGMRCLQALLQHEATSKVPIILNSVLSRADVAEELGRLPRNIVYVEKDINTTPLIETVLSMLSLRAEVTAVQSRVFLVHGHDDAAREAVARLLERMGLAVVILAEQPAFGRTIIEQLEACADVIFAVVLLTDDDVGRSRASRRAHPRARQNVIFELGYFVARLGRDRVCCLYKDGVEIPTDYHAVLYVPLDENGAWRTRLAKELQACGVPIAVSTLL